jgi:predicted amidohydrolase YtcJ
VARRYPGEAEEQAWHPAEAITVEEGLRAYTINPALASHQESFLGSITTGKMADIVVLSDDVLDGTVEKLLATEVLLTVFNGEIVYRSESL